MNDDWTKYRPGTVINGEVPTMRSLKKSTTCETCNGKVMVYEYWKKCDCINKVLEILEKNKFESLHGDIIHGGVIKEIKKEFNLEEPSTG